MVAFISKRVDRDNTANTDTSLVRQANRFVKIAEHKNMALLKEAGIISWLGAQLVKLQDKATALAAKSTVVFALGAIISKVGASELAQELTRAVASKQLTPSILSLGLAAALSFVAHAITKARDEEKGKLARAEQQIKRLQEELKKKATQKPAAPRPSTHRNPLI